MAVPPLLALAGAALAAVALAAGTGAQARPSGGPAAVVDVDRPAAAAPPATRPGSRHPDLRHPDLRHPDLRHPADVGAAQPAHAAGVGEPAPRAGFVWPLRPRPTVVRGFAPGPHRWSPGHRGVDLAAPAGADVLAVATGTVRFAGRVAGRGVVSVVHASGLRTTYEPVAVTVRTGDHVVAGQPVGLLAATPSHCPPAACLHLGALLGDAYVDPLRLLRPGPPVLLPAPAPGAGGEVS